MSIEEPTTSEESTATSRDEQLKAQRRKQKLSVVFAMPDLTLPGAIVSQAESDFFIENGFLIKSSLLDLSKLAPAMDRIWAHTIKRVPVLEGSGWALAREDSATWMNPRWAAMPPHPDSGPRQGRQPVEYFGRIVKLHDLGNAEYLLDLMANDQAVRAVARALLGEDLRPSVRTRGVYAVFPTRDATDPSGRKRLRGTSLGPHADQVCQQLNACGYLDDVAPRSGGFTVYPGSHKIMFQAHKYESNWSPLPSYREAMREVVEDIEPYELIADKGSVIFWHGRTVHSSGIHIGTDIRWALFADFTQNREILSDEEHKHCGQFEWFKDAKLFKEDWPVSDDMWRNWNVSGR